MGVEGEAVSICLGGAFRLQFSLKIIGGGGGSSLDPQLKGDGRVRQTERTLLAGIIS